MFLDSGFVVFDIVSYNGLSGCDFCELIAKPFPEFFFFENNLAKILGFLLLFDLFDDLTEGNVGAFDKVAYTGLCNELGWLI